MPPSAIDTITESGFSVEPHDHIVFIVDDDHGIRDALLALLASHDMQAVAFASAAEYMAYPRSDVPACLVLDLELPDINGLDLQRRLANDDNPQIVFITAHGDIPSSVRAMKAGAVDFLTKPFRDTDLMRAINSALDQSRRRSLARAGLAELRLRYSTLTPRERDVLPLVVSGLLTKQAAAKLGISETTTQIHRGQIMRKMHADSLAELVRMAGILQIPIGHPRHGSVK
jgi:FixJ family two-component response regulator